MKLLFMILFILLSAATCNGATFDPSFRFKTRETEHFSIHYHQGLEGMAARTSVIAEQVHARLSPLLGWNPEEKTNLILADNSDFANGMATTLPWNAIYLQTVPPDIMSTIGEYDDWLRLLIVHEYAHILTSDPVRGYSRVMRRIFGKTLPVGDISTLLLFLVTAPPNVMMPGWWHEGMATWSETELTSAGRGRSSFYDMIFRTAVAEKNLPTIDLINGDVPYWPAGNLRYIFGSRLIQYIAETYGKDRPGKISIQQSGRFPYAINGSPEDQLDGRDYPALYRDMLASLTKEQEERIALLGKQPVTPLRRIGADEYWDTSPRFSPDGSLVAFNRDDRHNHQQIVITDRDGKVRHSLRSLYGDGALTWSPDGRRIYFSQAELQKNVNLYQDIYRYDLDKDKLTRLTCSLRAGEPDLSPDGRTVAVIITDRGSQNLALLDLTAVEEGDCRATPKLLTNYREFRVAAPRWSPDSKSVVFTVTDNSGRSSLNLLKTGDSEVKTLISGHYSIATPAWSRDGKQIYYSSDVTGVFNISAITPEDGVSRGITHLLSGGFSPDSSPDGTLTLAHYTSKGFTVALLEKENAHFRVEDSPFVRDGRYPTGENTLKEEPPVPAPADLSATPYSPWKTFLPRFWLPSTILESPTGSAPGLFTAGQDILGYHTLLAGAWYGTEFNKGYYNLLYEYGRLTPSLNLQGYALPVTYGDLLGYGDYTEIENGVVASISLPVQKLESGLSLIAGYHLRDQRALSELTGGNFNGLKVFEGRRDSYFGGIDYSNALKYPWSISHEEGRTISGRANYYSKASGSDLDYREYTVAWAEFIRLQQHHTLIFRLAGGMAEGDQPPQQAFQMGGLTSELNPYGVRGYEPRFATGSNVATSTIEYRFPAWYFLRGINTKPVFFDRLHGAIFADAGEIWDKDRSFRGSEVKIGIGTEIRMDLTLGYWLKVTPAIGYARGLDRDGIDHLYFTIYMNM